MNESFLNTEELPFCKGCGHHVIAKSTALGLEKSGYHPLDVVLVTDIGCFGIIDVCFNTHTVHGLHGRSVALGAGIAMGLANPAKKVVVFIGDGGATIGLQHLLECARLNIDMTVIIHNNMLYGMTGGQASGLTPLGYRTTITPDGSFFPGYDICNLVHKAGAVYVRRIVARGDFSDELAEAFTTKGFSLVEVVELCPSYGAKLNPKTKIEEWLENSGRIPGVWNNEDRKYFSLPLRENLTSLFDRIQPIEVTEQITDKKRISIILGGSAGEGVQSAAEYFVRAAIQSGFYATKKGSYPVTVGVGFSTAEIILSSEEIFYNGITTPDVAIIVSKDGLMHNQQLIKNMEKGTVFLDESLEIPATAANIVSQNFRKVGSMNATLYALFYFVKESKIIPLNNFYNVVQQSSQKISIEKIKELLSS